MVKLDGLKIATFTSVVCSVFALTTTSVWSQWEPSKEVELIAHVKTSSSTYAFASAVFNEIKAQDLLKKGVKLRSVRGARGGKARKYVGITNKGDPHVLQVLTPSQINNPILSQSDVDLRLFKPVAIMVITPLTLAVPANSPYKSMKDIIDDIKARPGKVIHGGGAFGNVASLVGELWAREAGVKMPYAAFEKQGMLELLGGHIAFGMHNPAQVNQYVKAGKLKLIAASQKLGNYPEVKTFKESGFNFKYLRQYRGWWTSKDVSDDAVKYYTDLMTKVRNGKGFKDYISKNNLTSTWIVGAELDQMLKNEYANYLKLDTELGLIKKK